MCADRLVRNFYFFIDYLEEYGWSQYKNRVEGLRRVFGKDELIKEGEHPMGLEWSLEDCVIQHLDKSQASQTKH